MTTLLFTHTHTHSSIVPALTAYSLLSFQKLLHRNAGYLFVPLATQMVNDNSPLCRQMAAESIKTLLQQVREQQLVL